MSTAPHTRDQRQTGAAGPHAPVAALPAPVLALVDGRVDGVERRNRLMQFAGVDSTRVNVRSERVLYTAAGVILIAYTVYAFLGVFAFAWMATDSVLWSILGALTIGSVIIAINLSIDRGLIGYIPANLGNVEDPRGDARPVLDSATVRWARRLRVLLAILFALAVGEPANLFLFDKDVNAAMVARDYRVQSQQREISNKNFGDALAAQQLVITDATKRIDELKAYPDQLTAKAEAERTGKGATGQTGCGAQCRQYLAQAKAATATLAADVAAQQARIDAAQAELNRINTTKETQVAEAGAFSAGNTGFLAREEALFRMLGDQPISLIRYLILVIVFFSLEMGAVLTKYLAKGNSYERDTARRARLAEFASRVQAQHDRATVLHRADLNRRLNVDLGEHFYDAHTEAYAGPRQPRVEPDIRLAHERAGVPSGSTPGPDPDAAPTEVLDLTGQHTGAGAVTQPLPQHQHDQHQQAPRPVTE